MPRKKVPAATGRQLEIKRLVEGGADPKDIADYLKTSESAVKAQITKLRGAGLLPRGQRGRARAAIASAVPIPQADPQAKDRATATLGSNGALTIEQHTAKELALVSERLDANRREQEDLRREADLLAARRSRLEAANTALTADDAEFERIITTEAPAATA